MEARYLDHYSYLDSPIHRIPAHLKLAVVLVLLFLVLLIPLHWWAFHAAVALGLIGLILISGVPVLSIIRRQWWLWLVILGLSLSRIRAENGMYDFLSTGVKASLCMTTMTLLANTTRFAELLHVLALIGMPKLLVMTLSLMYRYLFVLSDEAGRMRRARQSRTFTRRKWFAWHTQATVIAHLFVRCVDRAQRIHSAMLARSLSDL